MTLLLAHFADSLRRPDHWLYGSWLDTVTKYRKTRLGLVWMLVPTIVYIWGIGAYLGTLQPGENLQRFLAHVGVGFVVYRLLMTVLVDATNVLYGCQAFIYDGNVRLTDYILRTISRSFYYFLAAQPLLAIAVVASPDFHWAGVPGSLLGMAVVVVNVFLYSVVLALVGARFPDFSELMSSLMMAAFLVTPIVWYPDAAPEGTGRGAVMRANPFHHLLAVVRAPLLGETLEPISWWYLAAMTLIGLVAAILAYRSFARRAPLWL